MPRTLIKDLGEHIGKEVSISGWVAVRRDQGKMVFFDFRDRSGSVQGVVLPSEELAMAVAKDVRQEYVVRVTGAVNARPEKNVNAGVMNGRIYRVGSKLDTPADTWELAPGGDFTPYDPDGAGAAPVINGLTGARAFIVGRNPVAGGAAYEGGAQDVAVYTTFVQVR